MGIVDDMCNDLHNAQVARSYSIALNQANNRYAKLADVYCSQIALLSASKAQIILMDPNHPLLHDEALRNKIIDGADAVFARTNNYDDVREFASKFPIPYEKRPVTPAEAELKRLLDFKNSTLAVMDQTLVDYVKKNNRLEAKVSELTAINRHKDEQLAALRNELAALKKHRESQTG